MSIHVPTIAGSPVRQPAVPDGAAPVIRLDGVSKTYPGRGQATAVHALSDVSLQVAPGAIFGVIGRSGAGKSTLIRLLNGLERPTSGSVSVRGEDIARWPERRLRGLRRQVGMVFQHFALLSSRTAHDNVALPLEIAGVPTARIRERVGTLLDLVGLADKAGRYPAELSGGQKQRVGIARALATEPGLLLCDEATSALDPETTAQILALLARVNHELGVTIALITHEIPVIKEICSHVAVLEAGRVVEQGRAFEVLTSPAHPTTASFVSAVTGVAVPPGIAERLRPDRQAGDQQRQSAVIRIVFTGAHATAPVISRITSTLGLDVNILAGRVDQIGGTPFGALVIAIPAAEPGLGATLAAVRSLDLTAEVLGYVA